MNGRQQHPLRVYVTGRTDAQPLPIQEIERRAQQLQAAATPVQQTLEEVTAELTKQHGEKRIAWPQDAWAQYTEAWLARDVATAAVNEPRWFGTNQQNDIDDSVNDLEQQLQNVKEVRRVQVVQSLDAAELVVRVRGRNNLRADEVFAGGSHVEATRFIGLSFWVGPAVHLPAERAGAMEFRRVFLPGFPAPVMTPMRRRGTEPPRWEAEFACAIACYSYKDSAVLAAFFVQAFGDKNYDALEAGRKIPEEPRGGTMRNFSPPLTGCR